MVFGVDSRNLSGALGVVDQARHDRNAKDFGKGLEGSHDVS